jgi:Zn-dependent peptidase ImmA (M78 family)
MIDDTSGLEAIFGPESSGSTPAARAASSRRLFVRSQIQIAEDSACATGPRLKASEALESYGIEVLERIAEDGSAVLAVSRNEPAQTLQARREALGVTPKKLAGAAGLTVADVTLAETPGEMSRFQVLRKLAQWLALDEATLGRVAGAKGDARLGVRLKSLTSASEGKLAFSEKDVLALSEAAWIITKQAQFETLSTFSFPNPSDDFSFPTYEQGYLLAAKTRKLLGLSPIEPVPSMRVLLEEHMKVAVVQREMNEKIAGATVASGGNRGVVINESGQNKNVWVRRMTLAHELCHLMWDSDQKLETLVVDRYDSMRGNPTTDTGADPVEIRANAFAVAFLAPIDAVQKLANQSGTHEEIVLRITRTFGISVTAAKFHIKNSIGKSTLDVQNHIVDQPSDEWKAAENLTVDFFPIQSTPSSRRGRFAYVVALAYSNQQISCDTAASLLDCQPAEIELHANTLIELGSSATS